MIKSIPIRTIMFEMGSRKSKKIERNKSFPVNSARRHHKVAASIYPKNPIIIYHVKAKPYISMNRATKNAK